MTKKIFQAIFLSTMGIFLGTVLLILGYLFHYFSELQLEQLSIQTNLIAQAVEQEGFRYLENLDSKELRITWIAPDGDVLYDSEKLVVQLDNHADREEVREAQEIGFGQSIRESDTLTQRLFYSAQRLADGTVLRLSLSQQTIWVLLGQLTPWMGLLFILSSLSSLLIAKKISKKLLEPLETVNLENPFENDVYIELSPLLNRLEQHQTQLAEKESLLQQKRKEFDTIISKMKEGIVIVDKGGYLVSYNGAAGQLLGLDRSNIGQIVPAFSRHLGLRELLEEGLAGQKAEKIFEIEERQRKVLVRPVWAEAEQTGAVLLFFDVTEQYYLDKLRREFTATVSHELRTPLHILFGYSEMLQSGLTSPESVQLFSMKIHQETRRMIQLVEDILQLAQLDEGGKIHKEVVNMTNLTEQVLTGLNEKIKQKGLTLTVKADTVHYKGNPALLQSIIYNLCDNAIKYNKENGRVTVELSQKQDSIVFQVADTGLGIAAADKERIFERFYRADKSRSKQVGGTGLGLSIVKYALQVHSASIEVDSDVDQGTTMTVTFPKI
ncbi:MULTISPECIES: cell wall metabolism sensor histidine kinase WalK [unclassified Streptococcus]|uniref:sensor histidine kinase n=1 Tax=unclassified Streptococcus TaxID=2608887 RepID=UPI0010728C47|nr:MULTISPECIES: ATP-binding protein [unclassified Streptococcus]MBF0788256.1 PAS domain-containing sensor histidine kinase [Streptococcus sp. 19428wC2_LYSM12]MCQ9212600.1 cell wall metabolism sensor histidine kinase WalK [Streptococcus sp. B01]MCQ9213939.1 cell wall metabolism sensor histidine kinase WalK [Streptococcus sp. O1]TFV04672.1 PAS domain-containing sensor histidine kinase [Streptococcus sp. LYSM12]